MNGEGIKKYNSNNGIVKDSIPSTAPNNQLINPKNQIVKNSCISLASMKIPCFEWKTDINKGTKTAEYYLNSYYHKKKNNSSRISLNNNKGKKNDSNGSNIIDDSIINIEDLPFNFSEHIMSMGEEEKVIRILKNQIVFQGVSPEILSYHCFC